MVFDIWNNEVIIRLFNAFLRLIEYFYFVFFGTKGAVCKIWQHLVAKMAIRVLAPLFKGEGEPTVAAGEGFICLLF